MSSFAHSRRNMVAHVQWSVTVLLWSTRACAHMHVRTCMCYSCRLPAYLQTARSILQTAVQTISEGPTRRGRWRRRVCVLLHAVPCERTTLQLGRSKLHIGHNMFHVLCGSMCCAASCAVLCRTVAHLARQFRCTIPLIMASAWPAWSGTCEHRRD